MNTSSKDPREEAYKIWRARAAEESERLRQEGKISIWLERGEGDAETFTKEHQAELGRVVGLLRKEGVELEAPFMAVDAADAVSGYTGQLIISLITATSSVLIAVLVAWIKRVRNVRVEFHPNGKLRSIEAQNDQQVLAIAEALNVEVWT